MIRVICFKCHFVFMAPVILGPLSCPKCGHNDLRVAAEPMIDRMVERDREAGTGENDPVPEDDE